MRYNTIKKRQAIEQKIIEYLVEYPGYGTATAMYEARIYVQGGLSALTPTAKRDIKCALMQIHHNRTLKP